MAKRCQTTTLPIKLKHKDSTLKAKVTILNVKVKECFCFTAFKAKDTNFIFKSKATTFKVKDKDKLYND